MADETALRTRLREILPLPTAPFHEGRVHAALREAGAVAGLRERLDPFGNLELVYGRGRPALVFACHTDHPAFLALGDGTARVVGGIRASHLPGARVRTLDGDGRIYELGRVKKKGPPAVAVLKGGRGLKRGTPLVLDVPGVRFRGGRIYGRAVDDLVAVAACLATADALAAARWKGTVGFLFTRAEEVGFAGALAWTRARRRPKSTTIVNLEMSNARPHTPPGDGPILRVGDRISTFDGAVSLALATVAVALQKKDASFRFQRALMDGGACEATVYHHAGHPTGALCLPLKNYHNHTRRGGLGPEYVDEDDAENLVRWMTAFARAFGKERADPVGRRLAKLWKKHEKPLRRSAAEGRGR